MLTKIFKVMSFYDKIRWDSTSNYDTINFFRDDLDYDTKILTHWLCYITDRQMPYKRIWDLGGFVFSELVNEYKTKGLSPIFVNKTTTIIQNKGDGYVFRSLSKAGENKVLRKYEITSDEVVEFIPRYYSSDYFSIIYTLSYLDAYYEKSLSKFIVEQILKNEKKSDFIVRILFSLYVLTYHLIGQPKKEDVGKIEDVKIRCDQRNRKVHRILNENFENEFESFKKDNIFKQKRVWCALRDYFKSPEFKGYFIYSLREEGLNEDIISSLFTYNNLSQFELPGDVWNNNSKFRNCILEEKGDPDSRISLNKILRDYFEEHKDDLDGCYPEQFDITFDFVPRMCQVNNCDICPIGYMKSETENNFLKTCANNRNLFCTVGLSDCNYKVDCQENECQLLELINTKQKQIKSNK